MVIAKNTIKYNPGFTIGHSGLQKLNNIKFLIAQLKLRKQIKMFILFEMTLELKNNKIAIPEKKV